MAMGILWSKDDLVKEDEVVVLLLEDRDPPPPPRALGRRLEALEDRVIADWGLVVRPEQLRRDEDSSALCWLILRTFTRFFIMVRLATSTVRPSTCSRFELEQAPF